MTETPSTKDDLSKTVKSQSSLEAKIAIDRRAQSVDNSTNNRNITSDKIKANMNPINDTTSDKVKLTIRYLTTLEKVNHCHSIRFFHCINR